MTWTCQVTIKQKEQEQEQERIILSLENKPPPDQWVGDAGETALELKSKDLSLDHPTPLPKVRRMRASVVSGLC